MITSTANEKIKLIRKLKDRKYRNESGLFFMEGIRIIIDALQVPECVSELIVARELIRNDKINEAIQIAEDKGISILDVSVDVFQALSGKEGPQGIAAIGQQKWYEFKESSSLFKGVWIALYQIADPGNLGTIIRTMDGMGSKGIILLDNCTDPYDPTSIRASMGALFSKKLIKTNSNEFINQLAQMQTVLVGSSDSARTDFHQYRYPKDMILLMGSERQGLPESMVSACNAVVSIPMKGNADSLNLAVASSIIFYEIEWQHRE